MAIFLIMLKPNSVLFIILYIVCGLTDMLDGCVARKTHTESDFGARLDSIADIVFVVVCLIKILPLVKIELWICIWIAVIAMIKAINIIFGFICNHCFTQLHTKVSKLTGLLLFLLPLTIGILNINYIAIPLCTLATFAAVQEGHFIRTGRIDK